MNKTFALSCTLALLLACGSSASAQMKPGVPLVNASLAEANAAFALDAYRVLGKKDGNVTFSPASISLALGMTYAGARNATVAELEEVLMG